MFQWSKSNDALGTVNRGNPAESGLCTLCRADCKGKCETWLASLRGRELLYPRDFGSITAGSANTVHVGVTYNSLRIQGYNYGSYGTHDISHSVDDCIFPNVDISTEFGNEIITKAKLPIMTGALGSTFVAGKYWESFAIGSALVGIPIVIGENVVGVDRTSVIENGKIKFHLQERIIYSYASLLANLNLLPHEIMIVIEPESKVKYKYVIAVYNICLKANKSNIVFSAYPR